MDTFANLFELTIQAYLAECHPEWKIYIANSNVVALKPKSHSPPTRIEESPTIIVDKLQITIRHFGHLETNQFWTTETLLQQITDFIHNCHI